MMMMMSKLAVFYITNLLLQPLTVNNYSSFKFDVTRVSAAFMEFTAKLWEDWFAKIELWEPAIVIKSDKTALCSNNFKQNVTNN